MLRIRDSALEDKQGRLLHKGTPFSGLVYEINEHGFVTRILEAQDGVRMGESHDWFELPPGSSRWDAEHVPVAEPEGDGPLLFENGEPIVGVMYTFDEDGYCVCEEQIVNGDLGLGRAWYASGEKRYDFDGEACPYWLLDGTLYLKDYQSTPVFQLLFDDTRNVNDFLVRDRSLIDAQVLNRLPLAAKLRLVGESIDDNVLHLLCKHSDIAKLESLSLVATSISFASLDELRSLPHLKTLQLTENPGLYDGDVELWKAARADCTVRFFAGRGRSGANWLRFAMAYASEFRSPDHDLYRQAQVAKEAYERAMQAYYLWRSGHLGRQVERMVNDLRYRTPSPFSKVFGEPPLLANEELFQRYGAGWADGLKAVLLLRREAKRMLNPLRQVDVLKQIDAAMPPFGAPSPPIADWSVVRPALEELFERVHLEAISERGPRLPRRKQ